MSVPAQELGFLDRRTESREVLNELHHLARTLSQVPQHLQEINRKLDSGQALLATKAELQEVKTHVKELEGSLNDLEERVNRAEKDTAIAMAEAKGKAFWQDKIFGYILAAVASIIAAYFGIKGVK